MDLGWAGIPDGSGSSMVGVGSFGSLGGWGEYRKQRAEDRRQKGENRRQKADFRRDGVCALVGF